MKLPKLNWRSTLSDLRLILVVLLLVPTVGFTWWQAVGCARASTLSPACLIEKQTPSFYAAPKGKR